MKLRCLLSLAALLTVAAAPPKLDPDTAAWWSTTAQLSNDSMEGRDTGTAAYERAARLVASKLPPRVSSPPEKMAPGSSGCRCTRPGSTLQRLRLTLGPWLSSTT